MALIPTITTIQKSECIGNSLVTINANYANIKASIETVNTDILAINSSLNNLTTILNSISATPRLASAWVNFRGRQTTGNDGQATTNFDNINRHIESSYNITSVIRQDTGKYLVNISPPLVKNFVVTGTVSPLPPGTTGVDSGTVNLDPAEPFPLPGTSQCRIITRTLLGQFYDPPLVMLVFHSK
jgi:hypothetical protein